MPFNKTNLILSIAPACWENGNGTADKYSGNFPAHPAQTCEMALFNAGQGYVAVNGHIECNPNGGRITTSIDVSPTNASKMTFETWFTFKQNGSTQQIFTSYNASPETYLFCYIDSTNMLYFGYSGTCVNVSTNTLTDGQKYHVVFVKNGSALKTYINKVEVSYSVNTAYSSGAVAYPGLLNLFGYTAPLSASNRCRTLLSNVYSDALSLARIEENYDLGETMGNLVGRNTGDTMALLQKSVVAYNANGGAGTIASEDAIETDPYTVKANAFTRAGYTFVNFNTAANGTGTPYAPAATFAMPAADVTLFAQWAAAGGRKKPLANNVGCGAGI